MQILKELQSDLLKKKPIRLVFIGDSITSTEWVHPNWREIVEYVLKEELAKGLDWKLPSWGIRCFNCAFDGSTTSDILERLDEIVALKPTHAVYVVNTNDHHEGVRPGEFVKNVRKILDGLGCKVLVSNSIPGNTKAYTEKWSPYALAVSQMKFKNTEQFVDTFAKFQTYPLKKFFTFVSLGNPALGIKKGDLDFVHPNQLGNAYLAKDILSAFGVLFDPEKFIAMTSSGMMYPEY